MNIKHLVCVLAGVIAIVFAGPVSTRVPIVQAQTLQYWSDPVNISKAGSSTDPAMVIDSDGVFRVIWIDTVDEAYKYVESTDGKVWTTPVRADFPFSPKDDSRPTFLADHNGLVYIFWRDDHDTLYYAQAQARNVAKSSSWRTTAVAAYSVVGYDAVVDSQDAVLLSYVKLGTYGSPAGVYYSRVSAWTISKAANLYLSEYFRGLDSTSAHIRVAVSQTNDVENVYVAWDDRPQKRIFMAKSSDGGKHWGEASQIIGPEALSGISLPFNVELGVFNQDALLIWQVGQPDGECTTYSAWSADGGEQFGLPVKVVEPSAICGQASKTVLQNEDYSIVLFNAMDDISLVAWNGVAWSDPQSQNETAAFLNPVTLDSVIYGCQKMLPYGNRLYMVGCDQGSGGDIWFTSRSLGTIQDWFPPSSVWSAPVELTDVNQQVSGLSAVADSQGTIHAFWIQAPLVGAEEGSATIQYARWNGEDWSIPMPIFSQSEGLPMQLNARVDRQDRLLIAWVDSKTGDMFFNWASAARAKSPAEWQKAQYIPSPSQSNTSPDILVDDAGTVIVAYASPINENRGVYFVETKDGGLTWIGPFQVLDAASASWETVDQPQIALTADGRLHILFKRYSRHGDQRESLGLYYSQSADGGATWSAVEPVTEQPVPWSAIVGYGRSMVHRLWQEYQQSMLVTFDQVSQDGGSTWSRPATVSRINAANTLTTQTMDRSGGLHLLHLDNTGNPVISEEVWNGSAWISQASKELYIADRGVPSVLSAVVTSSGSLLASVSFDYPFLMGKVKKNILSMAKSLQLPQAAQTPSAAMIPAIKPAPAATEETTNAVLSVTPVSPLAEVNDAQSFWSGKKNLVGFLLIGAILVLLVMLFRSAAGKQNSKNGTLR